MKSESTGVYYKVIQRYLEIKYRIFKFFNKGDKVALEIEQLKEERRENIRFGLRLLFKNCSEQNFHAIKAIAWNEKEYDIFYEVHGMETDLYEQRGE